MPRTLEDIATELAGRGHWPDRQGPFALCSPCTERSNSLAGVRYPCLGFDEDFELYMKALHEAQDIGRT